MEGLPITITLATFQQVGKIQSMRQAFRMAIRNGFITGILTRRRSAEMPSSQGADFWFNVFEFPVGN